jgi:hypothetical protein
MTSRPLLAICIPTYRRTKEIIRNLEFMDFQDSRVVFIVSSNCEDDQLLNYCNSRSDIYYSQSKENRGFSSNLFQTLNSPKSIYSLIISDEDFIEKSSLSILLTHLEDSASKEIQYLVTTNDNFSLSSMAKLIGKSKLSYLDIMLTNPHIPTYMSGFIYPADRAAQIVSETPHDRLNAYPFLILRNRLLEEKVALHILSSATIHRGPESSSRDLEANYVDESVGIDRTNYFLSHYRSLESHNWLLEFWVASIILAQTRPGIKSGFLRFKLFRLADKRFIGIFVTRSPNLGTKLSYAVSDLTVFCSHIYRRIAIH